MSPYIVQVQGNHVIIKRHDGKPCNPSWRVLQRLKDYAVGADSTCVEVFPANENLVDEINARHLWVVPEQSVPCLKRRR